MLRDDEPHTSHLISQVLVIDRAYIAMIVGKGGDSITRIRNATESQILIQKPGMISPLTGPDEETVVVSRGWDGICFGASAPLVG